MPTGESQQKVIRHRSIFTLPTRVSFWSLVILTVVFFLLMLGYFLYTRSLVRELARDEDTLSLAAAHFIVNTLNPQTGLEDPERVELFIQSGTDTEVLRELFNRFGNPVVVTNAQGQPQFWYSIGVPEDPSVDDPKVLERVNKIIKRMDRQKSPFRIYNASLDELFVVHYGDPPALERLRIIPLYLGALVVIFLVLAVWILRRQANTERSLIWAGMARESAHQLGTPLSSLHGWLELLKLNLSKSKSSKDVGTPATAIEFNKEETDIIEGLAQDIERLSKIANRFELIGRRSGNHKLEIGRVLRDTERYFRARLPKRGTKIDLRVEIEDLPPVRGNATLLEWAFENIIKNSIDAMENQAGTIWIHLSYHKEKLLQSFYLSLFRRQYLRQQNQWRTEIHGIRAFSMSSQ